MQTYTKYLKITFLNTVPVNDKAYNELPKKHQVPCLSEYVLEAKEQFFLLRSEG